MKKINDELMLNIASYMNDEIREDLHCDLAPCSNETFLKEYLKRDPEFKNVLWDAFRIEV